MHKIPLGFILCNYKVVTSGKGNTDIHYQTISYCPTEVMPRGIIHNTSFSQTNGSSKLVFVP
jgi:hypothetical protein